mgnify:FL=1
MRYVALSIILVLLMPLGAAQAGDRHAGYYYPEPSSIEVYTARAPILPGNDRKRRRDFVSGIIKEIADEPYPPTYAIFAKGAEGEKLIITAVRDGFYDTVFRARALLAALTALSRATPLFQEFDEEDQFTFFDLCYMLGFKQLTVSDGKNFAHQITFTAPDLNAASGSGSK